MRPGDITETDALQSILQDQLQRYPMMQMEDLYKLVFQAAMGSEHAVPNRTAVQDYMQKELASLGDGPDEPLIDPISPDGEIARVHLRPYIRAGADLSRLLEAFIETSNRHRGNTRHLKRWWRFAAQQMQQGRLPFDSHQARSFLQQMETQDFPAVHHSQIYLEHYRPAYRVVLRGLIEKAIG
jgi:hypothetical protein